MNLGMVFWHYYNKFALGFNYVFVTIDCIYFVKSSIERVLNKLEANCSYESKSWQMCLEMQPQ